jgi:hypothetical protein
MVKDRFDFEQDIFHCWRIIDDLKHLYGMIWEDTSTDDIANILLGMQMLYDDRFRQLMDTFEHLISVDGFSQEDKSFIDDKSHYEKKYKEELELLSKLRKREKESGKVRFHES